MTAYPYMQNEKMIQKRARLDVGICVLILFVTTLVSRLLGTVYSLILSRYLHVVQRMLVHVLSLFGVSNSDAIAVSRYFFASSAFSDFFNIIIIMLSLVVPGLVFSKILQLDGDECFCTSGRLVKGFLPLFCLCQLVTTAVSEFSTSMYDFIVPRGSDAGFALVGDTGIFSLVLSVLCTCVIVPIAEEFVFRGVIFSRLKKHGLEFAVVVSAIIFGIAHSSAVQSVYAFTFGIISALLVCVTGNIKTSIIFHALNNLVSVLTDYLGGILNEQQLSMLLCVYYAIVFTLSFFGLYCFCRKDGFFDSFKKKAHQDETLGKARLSAVLCGPFVVYIMIYAAEIVIKVM